MGAACDREYDMQESVEEISSWCPRPLSLPFYFVTSRVGHSETELVPTPRDSYRLDVDVSERAGRFPIVYIAYPKPLALICLFNSQAWSEPVGVSDLNCRI